MVKQLSITVPDELHEKLMKIKEEKYVNLSSWISSYLEKLVNKMEEDEQEGK